MQKKTSEKIIGLGWEVLPHPQYWPCMAPSDFHLFRSIQHFLSGNQFEKVHDVQNASSIYFAKKLILLIIRSCIENFHSR